MTARALLLLVFLMGCAQRPPVDDDDSVADDDDTTADDDDTTADDDDTAAVDCSVEAQLLHDVELSDTYEPVTDRHAISAAVTNTNPCDFAVEVSGVTDDCMMRSCDLFAPDGREVDAPFYNCCCYDEDPVTLAPGGTTSEQIGVGDLPVEPGVWRVECRFLYTLNGVPQDITVEAALPTGR